MKLKEIAAKITEHLKRFEADPSINCYKSPRTTKPYYHACSWSSGNRIGVCYVSYQCMTYLTKAEAESYLNWLDQGGVGTFYRAGVR